MGNGGLNMKQAKGTLLVAALLVGGSGTAQAFLPVNIQDVGRVFEVGEALTKATEHITPEQEYYLGRAVGARLLVDYPLAPAAGRDAYLSEMAAYLARFSGLPETFAGYRVALVDSPEVNAFAAPGGLILITTGLYRQARSEDQLAAVLAHEIAHVSLRHGVSAIQQANFTQAGVLIARTWAERKAGGDFAQVQQLAGLFGTSVDDIVRKLVVSGYAQDQEFAADREAMRMLYESGYDPTALAGLLANLAAAEAAAEARTGFFATHPPAADRLVRVEGLIATAGLGPDSAPVRDKRFAQRH